MSDFKPFQHRTTGETVSARELEPDEEMAVNLADGAHYFKAGDFEVRHANNTVKCYAGEDFAEHFAAVEEKPALVENPAGDPAGEKEPAA